MNVCTIAKTYIVIKEENLFQSIRKKEAIDYLKTTIRPNQWRSAEWVDMSVPPRYGMTTSNISESANSMIEMGRKGTWLDCMHELISIMVLKIVKLRRTTNSNENKTNPLVRYVLKKDGMVVKSFIDYINYHVIISISCCFVVIII